MRKNTPGVNTPWRWREKGGKFSIEINTNTGNFVSSKPPNGNVTSNQSRMELALRASELSYRRLFEAAQDGILILDVATGCITDANPFLVKLLGYSHAEMVGQTVGELSPFKDIVSNQAMLERLQKDGYVRYEDLPLETKDGRKVAVEFVSNVYQAGDKQVIQCNIRDITARKKTERQLALLHTCVAHLNEIVMITEAEPVANDRIVFVNEAFERITGYTSAEVLGRSPRFLHGEKTDRRMLEEIQHALAQRQAIRRQVINYRKMAPSFGWILTSFPFLIAGANAPPSWPSTGQHGGEKKRGAAAVENRPAGSATRFIH